MSKLIVLADGRTTLVDDDVYEWAQACKWFSGGFKSRYAKRSVRVDGKTVNQYLHRIVMDAPKGREVDHINGDTLDNRRSNLRLVTRSQNEQGKRGARADSKTGVRGVGRNPSGTFTSCVWLNKKVVYRRTFTTLEEATVAVQAMRRELMTHAPECEASSW